MTRRSITATGLGVVVALTVASPLLASTLGVDAGTLRLDASAETGEGDISMYFETLNEGVFFSASGGAVQPGPGCEVRSESVVCSPNGITAVDIRGPRTADATLSLSGIRENQGQTPNVTGSVDGGAGRDTIDTVNDIADTVSCGAGLDVARADARDTVQADCEDAGGSEGNVKARLLPGADLRARAPRRIAQGDQLHPYGAEFRATCPQATADDSCGGRLDVFLAEPSLPKGRALFGSAAYAIPRGTTQRVRVLVGFGAADGQTAASYRGQIAAIKAAIKKRGRARLRAQIRSGSSRFQHPFSVTSIRRR